METILHTKIISWTKEKNIIYAKQRLKQVFVQEKITSGVINPILSITLIHTNQKHMCRNYITGWLCSPLLSTFVTETGVHSLHLKTVLRRLKGRMPCLTFTDLHSHLAGSGSECQMYFQKNVCFGLLLMQSLPSANKSSLNVYEQGAFAFHSCTQNV